MLCLTGIGIILEVYLIFFTQDTKIQEKKLVKLIKSTTSTLDLTRDPSNGNALPWNESMRSPPLAFSRKIDSTLQRKACQSGIIERAPRLLFLSMKPSQCRIRNQLSGSGRWNPGCALDFVEPPDQSDLSLEMRPPPRLPTSDVRTVGRSTSAVA